MYLLGWIQSVVEIYYKYELIATHARMRSPRRRYTTDASHMASQHRVMLERGPEYYLDQGRAISEGVEHFIAQVLLKKQHPEQAYKTCRGILSFAKRVGNQRLTNACQRAQAFGIFTYRAIQDILEKGLDHTPIEQEQLRMPTHDNIRGKEYFEQLTIQSHTPKADHE